MHFHSRCYSSSRELYLNHFYSGCGSSLNSGDEVPPLYASSKTATFESGTLVKYVQSSEILKL